MIMKDEVNQLTNAREDIAADVTLQSNGHSEKQK